MKKLMTQFIRFAGVGFLCFFIDFGVFKLVTFALKRLTEFVYSDIIGNVFGFSVSVIVNYYLSMKYVFVRKEGMDKKKEFTIFVVLSIIGGLLNTAIIWVMDHQLYYTVEWLNTHVSVDHMESFAKVVATAIVTVYNFVSRKLTLEGKDEKVSEDAVELS